MEHRKITSYYDHIVIRKSSCFELWYSCFFSVLLLVKIASQFVKRDRAVLDDRK